MNSTQINQLLNSHLTTRRVFVGVYPSDFLPTRVSHERPCAYIINLDPHYLPGSHWICYYFPKVEQLPEYFDSYGGTPNPDIESFLGNGPYGQSTVAVQNLFSTVCGQYCIYYIWKRIHDYSMDNILDELRRKTPRVADSFVNAYVERLLGRNFSVYDAHFLLRQIATAFDGYIPRETATIRNGQNRTRGL